MLISLIARIAIAFPALTFAGWKSAAPSELFEYGLAPTIAQQPPATRAEKRVLKVEDYAKWETLGPSAISPDGKWFAAAIAKVDEDGYLFVRNCDSPDKAITQLGTAPQFSDNSKWLAYVIQMPKKEADKLRDEKKPVEMKLGLRDMATGQERVLDSVQSFAFTKGSAFLVCQRYRPASRQTGGSDIQILTLADGSTVTVGNVTQFTIHKKGTLMAMSLDSGGEEKGVQVFDFSTGKLRDVTMGKGSIWGMSWAEEAEVLGFGVGVPDAKKEGNWNTLRRVKGFHDAAMEVRSYEPANDTTFPKGYRISENGALQWNEDASIAAFGIKEWEDKKAPSGKPEDKPNVDVWHYKDVDLQPFQQKQIDSERRRTNLCLWRPGGSFIQIGNEKVRNISLLKHFEIAIWQDDKAYADAQHPEGVDYSDWYVINTLDGHKTRFLEKRQFGPVPSREGNYLAYFARKAWWIYDIKKDRLVNATDALKRDFWDIDDDHTMKEKGPESFPVWLSNDSGVVFYDKYDAFLINPATGGATSLTDGRKDRTIYRLTDPGFGEEGIDLKDPLYFRAFGEWTKKSGYYRREPDGKGKLLVLDDVSFNGLRKAKDVDRMIVNMQTFVQSPNWMLTNEQFSAVKPLTNTNAQQKDFWWGKTELIEYKSKWGKPLQGILIYPSDYKPGQTYPMITYVYEKLSDGLHNYSVPVEWSSYNVQHWSQQGYFVLMPDIAYRDRQPGKSAVECLEPAVLAAVNKKVGVDPAKVGLVGHSWGGYQTAFVPTQSRVFAAAVAGAPLTELMSMYNSFYWNVGITDQVIFESSQGRMEVPWWEDVKAYADNSPVWQAKNLTTPMMIAFGDNDGAVDWHQGQQYYNTLRRMGKFIIMLVYPGENHGLVKRPNQKDYAHRVRHFFDVYLKGAKPEKWVTEGIPAIDKGKEEKGTPASPPPNE